MRPISYMSRLYVPPPIDPDDAGPIATKVSHRDIALVASKTAAGQYIYSQSVDIQVATARPIEIPAASSQTKSSTRFTIEVKTKDKSVRGKEVVMSWFPYSFDWESYSSFKGHHNRSKEQADETLNRIADGEIALEDYFRDNKLRDVFQGNSNVLTAYFSDAKRSDEQIWSRRRQQSDELLAFGICNDVEKVVDEIYREEAMLRLFSNVDDTILKRYWKDYSHFVNRPKPTLIRGDLLSNEIVERILKSSIRKAVAGPIRNQLSFIGKPVSSWATSVFLRALYNLNRTKETPKEVTTSTVTKSDSRSKAVASHQRPDFMVEVADYAQQLSENSDLDPETLKEHAIQKLTAADPGTKTAALALLMALSFQIEFDKSLREQISDMAEHDDDPFVRENAAKVLGEFAVL